MGTSVSPCHSPAATWGKPSRQFSHLVKGPGPGYCSPSHKRVQVNLTSKGYCPPRALACGSLHGGRGGSLVPLHTCRRVSPSLESTCEGKRLARVQSALPDERYPRARLYLVKAPLQPRAPQPCTSHQGLTLVHFSAQLERFYRIGGARRGCAARIKGVSGPV